ncbi:MAG TPA: pyrroline-5-carboxylate reductase [Myxococcota bacterium]|nr:pyrroline-5-carboxylate reductase [Myxococcota bacterium]
MTDLRSRRVGFVGGGAMAEALCGGLVAAGVPAAQIRASDPEAQRRRLLAERLGIEVYAENRDVVASSDVVVVAVKPSIVPRALGELRDAAAKTRPLWISIVAGVRLSALAEALSGEAREAQPSSARIVRAMPNTPAQVRCGATAICGNERAGADDLALARALFESVGICWQAPDESLLDAVTGLSGSGPAFVFVFLEALADAGVRVGLPRDAAALLARQTVLGAARLVEVTGRHPAELKDQVTSPGGTTIAGLERLEAGGLRAALYEAVAAATRRSKELAGS